MLRASIAVVPAVAVVVGGFAYGAIHTLTDEDWPDYE